ncbi:unnamed protein product [Polarella glacialis]|uniref:Uncharacterized protein n=1 Tax=Polarella glacialis TaxID=89957 RepID=A0A813H8Z9_POLGL|nr:unnamed protein product [Polarella glacialis]CAE8655819.1 unnamed protein product [Polarella glacialis]
MCSPPLFTNLPGLWQQQQHKKQQQRQQASMHPPSSHFNGRRAIPMAMSFFNGKVQLQLRHRQLPQQQQQQHQQQQQQQHNNTKKPQLHPPSSHFNGRLAIPMAMSFLNRKVQLQLRHRQLSLPRPCPARQCMPLQWQWPSWRRRNP